VIGARRALRLGAAPFVLAVAGCTTILGINLDYYEIDGGSAGSASTSSGAMSTGSTNASSGSTSSSGGSGGGVTTSSSSGTGGGCATGKTSCSGACVDLMADGANCGTCGHGCCGGKCLAGTCQPATLFTNPMGSQPWAIAVDASNVYWTNSSSTAGAVMMGPKTGGTAVKIAGANHASGIAVDNDYVYWTVAASPGAVRRAPFDGGAPVDLDTTLPSPSAIALDAVNAYVVNYNPGMFSDVVASVPKNGGPVTFLAQGQSSMTGIAVDMQNVYWTRGNLDAGVYATPLPDGGSVTLLAVSTPLAAWGITVSSGNVYWTEYSAAMDGTVKRRTPVGPIKILASGQAQPARIVVDGINAYWTNQGATNNGQIMKTPIAGGGVITPLATGQGSPIGIAADATCLYWVNSSSGEVMALAK
jgi:hypothetical protein